MKIAVSRRNIILIFTLAMLLVGIAAVFFLARPQAVYAADISKFDPGNLMSDAVMSDKDSMDIGQIQSFLNSKNRCNDRDTHKAAWYPHLQYSIKNGKFMCLVDDSFGGRSAAHIIWQVAQDYHINPQFLIVLLEKEQGLISDTWPNHIQYRTAAGFGCPDTAPCEAQYFGLENQLRHAANLFRSVLNGGWSNYPVGYTYVQYHPNAACGGSVINIQNRATSALYRYTPYQPNRSALDAGYGAGDACGAYGNRNTWMLFNDWFGQPQDIITLKGSIKLKYENLNGAEKLGAPFYNERTNDRVTWWQCFEKGCIIGNRHTGYWESKGSIRSKWAELGYENGPLGLPLDGEVYDNSTNSWSQKYQNGEIVSYDGGNHKYSIKGSIYRSYVSQSKNSLSIPTADERTNDRVTWWQCFEKGCIIGNRHTGYWESKGSIRSKWAELGYENGPLGLPIGPEQNTTTGCYKQSYENGEIKGCRGAYTHYINSQPAKS